MKILNKLGLGLILAIILFSFTGGSAEAADFEGAETYRLETGETVDDTLFVSATDIVIDGDVEGDLFASGQTVTVNGNIDGNLFIVGATVTVNGDIAEDIFAAGGTFVFTGTADDVRVTGGQITIKGNVAGDVMVAGGLVKLDSKIAGDAFVGTEELDVTESNRIGGKLSYATPEQNTAAEGSAAFAEFFEDEEVAPTTGSLIREWFVGTLLAVLGYVLIAWLLIRFVPGFLPRHDNALNNQLGTSVGYGLAAFIFLPIVIFIATLTMGILFGFGGAMAVALTGFSGLALIWLLSPIVVAHWLGTQFTDMGMTGILVAVAVAAILITLPLVGGIFALASYVLAIGSAILSRTDNDGTVSNDPIDPIDPIEKSPAAV